MAEIQIATDERLLAVLFDNSGLQLYPGGLRIPAASRAIREGDCVAINTATFTGAVAKTSQLSANSAQTDITIEVDDAHPFAVGDVCELDDGSDQEDVTIIAIDYTTNIITMGSGVALAAGYLIDDHLSVITNNQHLAVGIALTPLRDKRAAELGGLVEDVTPREGTRMKGDIAITGRFRLARIRNLVDGTTPQNFNDVSFAGTAIPDVGVAPGLYVVNTPSANLALT